MSVASGASSSHASYSARQVEKLVGLHRASLSVMVRAGVVTPVQGGFSDDDVMVLRTAKALREAGIAPRKVVNALARLRRSLGPGQHLARVRLKVHGKGAESTPVDDASRRLEVWTGHRLVAFDDLAAPAPAGGVGFRRTDAQAYVDRAGELEHSDLGLAEAAYRRALALDPQLESAYLNLGAMLCEHDRCAEALALYDAALSYDVDTALLHFHRGLALEELDRHPQAAEAHRRAIELDDGLADAHYHLGLLAERDGDAQSALRHFGDYRRLMPAETAEGRDSEWAQDAG